MKKGLALFAICFLSLAIGENTTCELPADYVKAGELKTLSDRLVDDSASTRRMVEVNTRKMDELMNRQYASKGEVQNLSDTFNSSITRTHESLKSDFSDLSAKFEGRLQQVRLELLLICLFSITVNFMFGEWMNKKIYREFQERAGVIPRRTPMTSREKNLQARIDKLEGRKENKRGLLDKAIPLLKTVLFIAMVLFFGLLFIVYVLGVV